MDRYRSQPRQAPRPRFSLSSSSLKNVKLYLDDPLIFASAVLSSTVWLLIPTPPLTRAPFRGSSARAALLCLGEEVGGMGLYGGTAPWSRLSRPARDPRMRSRCEHVLDDFLPYLADPKSPFGGVRFSLPNFLITRADELRRLLTVIRFPFPFFLARLATK